MKEDLSSLPPHELSEMELLRCASAGDEASAEELLERYKPLVLSRASAWGSQLEREELIQEAMIGLFRAVSCCPTEKWRYFSSYAWHVVDNRICDISRRKNAQKRKIQNEALSIDACLSSDTDTAICLGDTIKTDSADPETIALEAERWKELSNFIESNLTLSERSCLTAYLAGDRYGQIAKRLGMSRDAVEGAIRRSKEKLRAFRTESGES